MITIPGKIPVIIQPIFLFVAFLIGYWNGGSFSAAFLWMGIIIFSVLIHEFGHAITAYYLGQKPRIELIALGGRTSYESRGLTLPKQFLIVFDGPLFGFLLFLASYFLLKTSFFHSPIIIKSLEIFKLINFFWTLINLLPILPLDGGQLLRIALEFFFGIKGFKAALLIGMLIGVGFGLFFFVAQNLLLGALFFLFAFESFDLFRRSKYLEPQDRKEEYASELLEAETALKRGDDRKARELLQMIRQETKHGMIFTSATQFLALLALDDKNRREAYELLKSIQYTLDESLIPLLQELAFEETNYALVTELSTASYQQSPVQEVALRNARAFAALRQPKLSGGWLSTALEFGNIELEALLTEDIFASVKEDPEFRHFFKK